MPTPRPLKRHPVLQPFSREHMGGLVLARNLLRSAEQPPETRQRIVRAFLDAWTSELEPHFADEEHLLAPLVRRADDRDRLLREHRAIRALVSAIASEEACRAIAPVSLQRLGRLLHDHIRWEERVLFEHIQHEAGEPALQSLQPHAQRITRERPGSRPRAPARLNGEPTSPSR